jgi:glyoxylase-like metal-dependent hydrolase (beta-lactamase superfamily II)
MKRWKTSKSTEIYKVLSGRVNSYLVCHSNGVVLVDCGMNFMKYRLLKNIEAVISDDRVLDYLFLTHVHFDHCQNALAVSQELKAQVVVHSSEAYNLITGNTALPKGTMLLSKFIFYLGSFFSDMTVKCPVVEPNVIINNSGTLFSSGGLKIIHTPGHSSGSMCLIVDDEIALVGDTLYGVFPNKVFPPFADSVEDLTESWMKLLDTNCSLFLPGHGRAIKRETLEKEFSKRSI